jgi:CRP-like cAMP-binding protein
MSDQSQAVQTKVVETIAPELFAQLRNVPILSSLKDEELHCVEGVADIHLGEGEFLAHQGDPPRFFWILLEGEIRVFHSDHEGTLYKMQSGNAFGELPLLANIPCAVNLQATKPSHLLQLDEEQFWSLMTSCPQVRKAILANMS